LIDLFISLGAGPSTCPSAGNQMKFAFIHPSPDSETPSPDRRKASASWPPLGILYIASFLRQNGVDVSVLDQAAGNLSLTETVEWIRHQEPDILGISALNNSGLTAARISREVKSMNSHIVVVWGNILASFNTARILREYPFVDVVVRGEGELTCLEIARRMERGDDLQPVRGIAFRKNGHAIFTEERPLLKDVDSLPFPVRDLVQEQYHSAIFGVQVAPGKFTTVVSSRGCPYRCRFCGGSKLFHNIWRPRSVENIMDELTLLADKGYRQLLFVDDNFTLSQERVERLCQHMRKERLDLEWFCDSRVDRCSTKMLKEIARSGCKMLYLGIESANQRILDYYNKRITVQQSEKAVQAARSAGIDVIVGSFIVGAPDETREEILNTLRFAHHLDIDIAQFNILRVFPGTQIWDDLKQNNLVDENKYWESGVYVPDLCFNTESREEMKRLISSMFRNFYLRPSFIFKQSIRTLTSCYRLQVITSNLGTLTAVMEGFSQAAVAY